MDDDYVDNYFCKPVGRFAYIEEDEEPLYLLSNVLTALLPLLSRHRQICIAGIIYTEIYVSTVYKMIYYLF
jgi:hypothetical protein